MLSQSMKRDKPFEISLFQKDYKAVCIIKNRGEGNGNNAVGNIQA